ncbi:hypothetical protein GCM10022247_35700 [Allokutzneria multivorans]|uniref:Uncharacterized protein n=1 Tax=Allokutzneria multivorans TaxID=1142134 RepID=A0ABP7SE51_9PSEU
MEPVRELITVTATEVRLREHGGQLERNWAASDLFEDLLYAGVPLAFPADDASEPAGEPRFEIVLEPATEQSQVRSGANAAHPSSLSGEPQRLVMAWYHEVVDAC